MSQYFRPNRPRIVDETLEGETLVMDMAQGNYYSCVGASAFVWSALSAGCSTSETAELVGARYGLAPADATRDVDRFVEVLLGQEMIVANAPTEPSDRGVDRAALDAALDAAIPAGDYAGLGVERFDDLADLILLDPVHEVTEAGWPHPATDH